MVFDKEKLKEFLKDQQVSDTEGLQALLRDMTKEVIETLYDGELTDHLGYEKHAQGESTDGNSRNGKGTKKVKSHFGEIELEPPRDRAGTFDPQVVKKRQRDISGIEERVISMYAKGMSTRDISAHIHDIYGYELSAETISMYAKGMSTRDISAHIHDIYGYELSAETISTITEKVMEKAREWQSRPLEAVYPIVFMDGMVVKMRVDGAVRKQTLYVIIGIDLEGSKSCLGLYFAESESAKYWLTVMNELQSRGVEDILIFAVDNLSGISEAIEAVFPQAEIQKCIVHQIRNSLRFVPWKERKAVAADLKKIYTASSAETGQQALEQFSEVWDGKYPHISKSWNANWAELSTFYKYSPEIRKLIYTTNPIESFNRSLRKVTKTRTIFPNENACLKLVFLAVQDIEKKWNQKIRDWGKIYSQLVINFEERLEGYV